MSLFRFFSVIFTFVFIAEAGTRTDTLYTSGGAYLTRLSTPSAGITRANIDTSKTRHATADSATIPILKGNETHRGDSVYFAGIGRFAGTLYAPVVDIDSMVGNVGVSGYLSASNYYISNTGLIKTKNDECGIMLRDRGDISIYQKGGVVGRIDTNGTVTTTTLNTGSITLNGGSALTAYLDTTFYDSLYDGVTYKNRAQCRVIQVGKSITIMQVGMNSGVGGSSIVYIKGIPSKFRPFLAVRIPINMYIGGTADIGILKYDGSDFLLVKEDGLDLPSGVAGPLGFSESWIIN